MRRTFVSFYYISKTASCEASKISLIHFDLNNPSTVCLRFCFQMWSKGLVIVKYRLPYVMLAKHINYHAVF